MNEQTMILDERNKKNSKFKKILKSKLMIPVVIILLLAGIGIGVYSHFSTYGKTTKLGFEDIGELATQSVTCTSVRVDDKDRKMFGISIPFTETKIIYSYDTVIKAGIDFSKVKWRVDDTDNKNKKIYVEIPEVKVLSSEVNYDSFKVYHEDESVFAPISVEEHNKSMKDLQTTAEKDAIANGLYKNAFANAKVLLETFIQQVYNPDEYTIEFSEQKQEE